MNNKEPKRLYIEYTESEYGGEAIDPEDRWTSYTDRVRSVKFIRLHRNPPGNRFFYDSIELRNDKLSDLDKLYLAVIRYSTGNTFGRCNGCWHIVGVAPTYDIAKAMIKEALESEDSYKPWEGYFEHYEDDEVHTLEVV